MRSRWSGDGREAFSVTVAAWKALEIKPWGPSAGRDRPEIQRETSLPETCVDIVTVPEHISRQRAWRGGCCWKKHISVEIKPNLEPPDSTFEKGIKMDQERTMEDKKKHRIGKGHL